MENHVFFNALMVKSPFLENVFLAKLPIARHAIPRHQPVISVSHLMFFTTIHAKAFVIQEPT
jgi:hypothetical protein